MRRKTVSGIMLSLLMASILIVLTSPIPVIAQSNSATTVYLDPPTINGTLIGVNNTLTVNIMIRDGHEVHHWQAGMIFNASALECLNFKKGEFLENGWFTQWSGGTINNTAGVITVHGATILGTQTVNGTGRLAYLTFKVKALRVSDLHFRDANVWTLDPEYKVPIEAPFNIIDVYTPIVNATPHTVVTVSDSTGSTATYHSGFYDHSFSMLAEKIGFNVTGPKSGFSNVTIPKTLLNVSTLDEWKVMRDDRWLDIEERTITENTTHTSIYFTYTAGIHKVQIFGTHGPNYQLTVTSSPITGIPFIIDGAPQTTPYTEWLPEGSYTLEMPETHTVGEAKYYWNQWSDGNTSRSRTVTMNTDIALTAYYTGPYYQLTVTSLPMTGIRFTINEVPQTTPYTKWLLEGSYVLRMPETHNGCVWSHWWEDGDPNRTKTVTMNTDITLTGVFTYVPPPPPVSMEIIFQDTGTSTLIGPPPDVGDHIMVTLHVTGVPEPGCVLWMARISWNPSVLEFVKIEEGPFMSQDGAISTMFLAKPYVPGSGNLSEFMCMTMEKASINGSGNLAYLTFQVENVGSTWITVYGSAILDPEYYNITYDVVNGYFELPPRPPPPVGGKATPINIPMNKPETPTLWIWLTTIILSLVLTGVYVKKRKRDTRLKC